MLFDDVSFHDAIILSVTENSFDQTLDFLLNFPVNWEANQFEKKLLRFTNVVIYIKKEIPFSGYPAILEIIQKGSGLHSYNTSPSTVTTSLFKIEMVTNAGNRFLEFSDVAFIDP